MYANWIVPCVAYIFHLILAEPVIISSGRDIASSLEYINQDEFQVAAIPNGKPVSLQYAKDVLSASEAKVLISICDKRNGWIASLQKDDSFINDNRRTSFSCPLIWPLLYLPSLDKLKSSGRYTKDLETELELSWRLTQRFAKLLNVNEDRIEPLQIIRYKTGEFYKLHHDHGSYYGLTDSQRTKTLLVFLSDVPSEDGGGHTSFPKLDVKVLPRAGDGIIWMNIDPTKKIEIDNARGESVLLSEALELAVHEGLPPLSPHVVKYACNVWVREEAMGSSVHAEAYKTS